jgi:hypothetical protein
MSIPRTASTLTLLIIVFMICISVVSSVYLYTDAMRYDSAAMVQITKEGCDDIEAIKP